jgi:hypothetical protein
MPPGPKGIPPSIRCAIELLARRIRRQFGCRLARGLGGCLFLGLTAFRCGLLLGLQRGDRRLGAGGALLGQEAFQSLLPVAFIRLEGIGTAVTADPFDHHGAFHVARSLQSLPRPRIVLGSRRAACKRVCPWMSRQRGHRPPEWLPRLIGTLSSIVVALLVPKPSPRGAIV